MRRYLDSWRYIRHQADIAAQQETTIGRIVSGEGCHIERPFLQINGPEFISIGAGSSVGKHAWISCYDQFQHQSFSPRIVIGRDVRIGNYACITAIDEVTIGNNCLFSDYVYISDHFHRVDPDNDGPLVAQPLGSKGAIHIGDNCFIGMRASILPGAIIGDYCVVGSHAVVTKEFPPFSILAGIPAMVIKQFSHESRKWVSVTE